MMDFFLLVLCFAGGIVIGAVILFAGLMICGEPPKEM